MGHFYCRIFLTFLNLNSNAVKAAGGHVTIVAVEADSGFYV